MSTVGTIYEETIKLGHAKLLSTQTVSNVVFVTFTQFTSEFNSYHFDIINLFHNDFSYPCFVCQLSTNGGANWVTGYWWGAYYNLSHQNVYGTLGSVVSNYMQDVICLSNSSYPGTPVTGEAIVHCAPGKSAQFQSHVSVNHPNYGIGSFAAGAGVDAGANTVRFFFYSGTPILTGTIRMYGLRSGLI